MGCCQSCCDDCRLAGKGYLASQVPDVDRKINKNDNNKTYQDPIFSTTAIESNLGPTKGNIQIQWKNVTDISIVGEDIFPEQMKPWDIRQGKLGNCPLLSAAASIIARDPEIIKNIFKTKKVNTSNAYHLQFHTPSGDWNEVTVDGAMPCILSGADGALKPAFATYGTYQNAPITAWPMLLEKAYAKHYNSYAAINSANIAEAMYDLTGLPVESINLSSHQSHSQQSSLINLLSHVITHQNAAITAGMPTSLTNHHKRLENGLIVGHAYAVLELLYILEYSKFIIKLYNPWGTRRTGYWLGDWGPQSTLWTDDLRYKYNYGEDDVDKGIFCMPAMDFLSIFDCLNICHVSLCDRLVQNSLTTTTPPSQKMQRISFPNKIHLSPSPGGRDFVSFRHNESFILYCPKGGDFLCTVAHKEQRGVVQPGTISYPPLGFVILKPLNWVTENSSPSVLLPGEYEVIYKNTFWNRREVSGRTSLPPSEVPFICVPSCYYPQSEGYCYLSMFASVNISVSPVSWELKQQVRQPGVWSQTSKRRYKLKSDTEGVVQVFLCQQSVPGGPASSYPLPDSDKVGNRTWKPDSQSTRESRSATGLNNIRISIRHAETGAVTLTPYQGTAEVYFTFKVIPNAVYMIEPQVSKYDREALKFEICIYSSHYVELTPIG